MAIIMSENCAICGCLLHRMRDTYARPTVAGRSHATRHHYVAERFFGRSANRRGTVTESVFKECPWGEEGKTVVFCYECHEELIHNPVFLQKDISDFAKLVRVRGLTETEKSDSREGIAERIKLMHEVIVAGLAAMLNHAETDRSKLLLTDSSRPKSTN
jgi:hypothetical protein